MKSKVNYIVMALFFLVNLSPLFADFTVERNGDMVTIKENGEILKTVVANTDLNKERLQTIEALIQNTADMESNIQLIESMGEDASMFQDDIQTIENLIRSLIKLLK